jgi:hypothetical protein
VGSAASLVLSGEGPEFEFYSVAGATRLPDGRVVVLDGASREVRFFDPDGEFLFAIGRQGEGPGEFDRLSSVSRFRGDSLLVFDMWLRRATILAPEGTVTRMATFDPDLQIRYLSPLVGDTLIATTWSLESFMGMQGAYRLPYQVLTVTSAGVVLDTVAQLEGSGGYKIQSQDEGYRDYAPLIIQDGYVSTSGGQLILGSGETMEYRQYDSTPTLRQIVRAPALQRRMSSRDVASEKQAMAPPDAPSAYKDLVDQMQPPEFWPAFGDLELDPDGNVWVAEYWSKRTQEDEPVTWHVFDKSGEWIGTPTTPSRFTVLEIGGDYVLGVRRDSLDVETVEVLPISRR